MTREEAITYLSDYIYWSFDNPLSKAEEFYITNAMANMEIFDIDRYAWLNTLFGYDIGRENARQIDSYLYDKIIPEIETLDITYLDKGLIKGVVEELKLDLTFDKWIDYAMEHPEKEIGFTADTPEEVYAYGTPTGWYGIAYTKFFGGQSLIFGDYGIGVIWHDTYDFDNIYEFWRREFSEDLTEDRLICVDEADMS